jgi:hypothetical protein
MPEVALPTSDEEGAEISTPVTAYRGKIHLHA